MFDKLDEVVERYDELTQLICQPEIASNPTKMVELSKERAHLEPIVEAFIEYRKTNEDLKGIREMLSSEDDPELKEMAQEEASEMEARIEELSADLKVLLLPKDPLDDKNTILEIRAGTGGDEAALFAADLFRMYARYAESNRWKVEFLSESDGAVGGYKEVIALVTGDKVYSKLRYESGVHRVQRVPATESQGRIHTSACTVAVLPEADDVDIQISDNDIRVDFYRSSGPGGQSVNTTDSAVRITHLETGLVVTCQDEKSQHKNKAKALKILGGRVLEQIQAKQNAERSAERKSMVGSGDRSERIRTYNYPQNRVTDHRIDLTLHKLDMIISGDALGDVIDALNARVQAEKMSSMSESD
jgi:peptide chain release factor 1